MRAVEWPWGNLLLAVAGGLLLLWVALVLTLLRNRPDELRARDMVRLLPDLVRMLRRLAQDDTLPTGVRLRLWLLLAYLALPFDLIPDFIPGVGYADDAVITALVLRSVTRKAGRAALDRHWPGTREGLVAICRLAGVS